MKSKKLLIVLVCLLLVIAGVVCFLLFGSKYITPQTQDSASGDTQFNESVSKDVDLDTSKLIDGKAPYYVLQVDEQYADKMFGSLSFAESGCGICALCNAVYYTNAVKLDPMEVATWAHEAGLYNTADAVGTYNNMFKQAANHFADAHFSATDTISGSITSQELLEHLLSGKTAIINTPGHFMAILKYNSETNEFFVLDSMPGDFGKYDLRRTGITHTGGDWLTSETLQSGSMDVTGYILIDNQQ